MSSNPKTGAPGASPASPSDTPTGSGVAAGSAPKAVPAKAAADGQASGQAGGQAGVAKAPAAGAKPVAGPAAGSTAAAPAATEAPAQPAAAKPGAISPAMAAQIQAAMAAGAPGAPQMQMKPGAQGSAAAPQAPGGAVAPQAPGGAVAPQAPAGPPAEYSGPVMRDDPLLSCLVILSRIFSNPRSPAAIAHGLPIGDEGLSPELFLRAADRIGLAANKVKKRLDQIDSMTLPAVLLLKERKACVLLSVPKDGKVEVATPDTMDGSHSVPMSQLTELYSGQMLVVRPKIRLDTRSSDMTEAKQQNWFWGAVMRYMPVYFEVIVAALLVNFFTIATSLFSMQVYDRVVPNKAEDTLLMLAAGVLLVFGFDFILRTLRAYFLDMAGKSLDRKVSSAIFQQILSIRMAAGPQSSGAFASNIQSYETLRDFFTSATLSAIIDLPFVIIFLVIIFVIAGEVAIVPAILIPIVIAVSILVQFPMKKAVERSYRESAQKHATLVEAINGLDMIKATSAEGQLQRDWDGYVAASSESAKTSRFWSTIAVNFVMMSSNLAFAGVILVGCYKIFNHDPTSDVAPLTTGAMVAASMLTSRAMAPLGQIAGLIVRFHQSWTSLQGLNRMMALPIERPQGKVFLRRPLIEGAIEFRNVVFKYPNSQVSALEGVSFKIQPGERVGIVGRIGSGKTTIERLVLGLFEPTDGAVLIDGVDIRQLDPTDLRQSIGCVLQDPHLFFGSVKDNITLGAPYVDEDSVIRASTLAGVDQFVRQHPSGYDMPVGENGRYLSGGQRQSVAVARAMLLNPPILLLDEPTSSMDNSTENAFKARLGEIAHGKTMLLVTHRNSMLSLVDRLIELDRGKVVADGPKAGVLDALMKGRIRANEG